MDMHVSDSLCVCVVFPLLFYVAVVLVKGKSAVFGYLG